MLGDIYALHPPSSRWQCYGIGDFNSCSGRSGKLQVTAGTDHSSKGEPVTGCVLILPPVSHQIILSSALVLYQFSPAAFTLSPRPSLPSERQYRSIDSTEPRPLPSIHGHTDGSIKLTVIVPAYDEEKRLPSMLDEALNHLNIAYGRSAYEILIVDDGSKDATCDKALDFAKENAHRGGSNIRVIKLAKNRGKGGAVRHGMLHSRGARILFADADGASQFKDLALLERALDEICSQSFNNGLVTGGLSNGHKSVTQPKALALGSRAHMVKTDAVVKVSQH